MPGAVDSVPELDLERELLASGALREGHFELSSGLHSARYVQCAKLLEAPGRADAVGRALARRLLDLPLDSIVAPALGGLVIGYTVAKALDVPFRFVERLAGAMALRRGFELAPGERVVIVEDVVTTGGSALEAGEVVRSLGAEVLAYAAIIDRTGGVGPFDAPFACLHELEVATFDPASCPLCRQEVPLSIPGSRRS